MNKLVPILAFITLFVVACGLPSGDTATPRPTYTPYPTFTPETSSTTSVPTGNTAQESAPGEYVEMRGQKDWFFGTALTYAEKGMEEFRRKNYLAAIENLELSQRHRDKPSAVLRSWIGLSYQALEQYEDAIEQHTASIEIEDSVTERTNRGLAYLSLGLCEPAVVDARSALAMEPQSADNIHTDAEANYILGNCYAYGGQFLLALQHAEAALEISRENNYEGEYLADRELLVAQIRDGLNPSGPDTDFFLIPALESFEQGMESFNQENYQKAIESFESTKQLHGKPSTVIESWLGLSFQSLEQHDQAIAHFTRAIEIKDSAADRLNRSISYVLTDQCSLAADDAEKALLLPPHKEVGYHTEVEANLILANCLGGAGDYRLAYVHAEAALSSAISHDYPTEEVALLVEDRDYFKSMADAQN